MVQQLGLRLSLLRIRVQPPGWGAKILQATGVVKKKKRKEKKNLSSHSFEGYKSESESKGLARYGPYDGHSRPLT